MREILFRGKRLDTGEWVQGDLQQWLDAVYISADNKGWYSKTNYLVNAVTVGQYTGLTDKNDAKIFEGDIVLYPDCISPIGDSGDWDETSNIGAVEWDKNVMCFYFSNRYSVEMGDFYIKNGCMEEVEVIGNIHDNPEFLKGGAKE